MSVGARRALARASSASTGFCAVQRACAIDERVRMPQMEGETNPNARIAIEWFGFDA